MLVVNGSRIAASRFRDVSDEAVRVFNILPETTRPFFNDNLLAPALFMRHMHEDLKYLGMASLPGTGLGEKFRLVRLANEANRNAVEALKTTNHGNFNGWDSHKGLWRIIW